MALRLGVFGAPGVEADVLLKRLDVAGLEIDDLQLFGADAESESLIWRGRAKAVMDFAKADFSALNVAIFLNADSADASLDDALEAGITVLDASDVLFQRGDAPLFLAGMDALPARGVAIAGGVSSHVATLLNHLPDKPRQLSLSASLPVSSHGQSGIDALAAESARLLNGQPIETVALGQQIAFNVLSDTGGNFAASIEDQLSALLGGACDILCHCITVPVFYGHTLSLVCDFVETPDLGGFRGALAAQSRFRFYPNEDFEAASAALSHDELGIDIAELRLDRRNDKRLHCTLVGDNLRDGSVTNLLAALSLM